MKSMVLGLTEALRMTLENIRPLPSEYVSLIRSVGRVAASHVHALVDSPSIDASLKDGYALSCRDLAGAAQEKPMTLKVLGYAAAGDEKQTRVMAGTAVRVLTGAAIPAGADAVIAGEDVREEGEAILVKASIEHGKNILRRGADVSVQMPILQRGQQVSPGLAGLLAAGGHSTVEVFRNPLVALIGTGNEIVEPGKPLPEGKLYASNITTLAGWCESYGMETHTTVVRDDFDAICNALRMLSDGVDAVITSGGAWTGDRDLVGPVLQELGWRETFHGLRMGPGKASGFGLLNGKPLFILPGGPPSNLMGFLQIALPGLLALAGHARPGLPVISARLASMLEGREPDWTDCFFGSVETREGLPVFRPLAHRSRLSSIAGATAVASIPEGRNRLSEGSIIDIQLLK